MPDTPIREQGAVLVKSESRACCVFMSTPDNQQPKPGWLWYQPTTISGLRNRHTVVRHVSGGFQERHERHKAGVHHC